MRSRTIGALASAVMTLVLALSMLLLNQEQSRAAPGAPTVSAIAPANNATGVARTVNVTATFSEPMTASSINGSTFTLAKVVSGTATAPVGAAVTYDPATSKATLDPSVDLDPSAKYNATVKSGSSGVKDLTGTPMRNDKKWSFTTAATPPPPDTTPPDTTIGSGPSGTVSSTSASFTFSSSESNSTFGCALDGGAFTSCTSPQAYTGLANGSHTFSVRATDAAGNVDATPATRTWTINITAPPPDKIIAISVDDGPDPADTPRMLDVLAAQNVKATFFVLGEQATAHPDLVRREYQEGHLVQNHTYTHADLTKLSDAAVLKELQDTNAAITATGAPQPNLFRPPGGATNAKVKSLGASIGLTQTLWNVTTNDWENPPPEEVCNRAVNNADDGGIMLLHDGGEATNSDEALECIITRLRGLGYAFGLIYPTANGDVEVR
jgi:peptidoglycan/xylan/chitin deacetylase (PgdA/CDA1 family)